MVSRSVNSDNEYFFNKGMYIYDPARLEKSITVSNYYEYLSSGIIKQKWQTIFEKTRLFQIGLVASRIKFMISGIRNDTEMENFYLYLSGLLHIYEQNTQNFKEKHTQHVKSLRNLKLQDPLLYDFKKIYKSNVIYSKICQKPHQPIIMDETEYKQLDESGKSRITRYWNFTKQIPAYYSCPSEKYPHMKFTIKRHPLDWCIPCCQKVEMSDRVNIKKQNIHNECLKKFMFHGEKINLTKGSHYIATYGKSIEVGRLSRLPENTLEPLFFDKYSNDAGIDPECIMSDGYYLLGIEQNLSSVQNIGFLHCLVISLKMTVSEFLLDCKKKIKSNDAFFKILISGDIHLYFQNTAELIKSIEQLYDMSINGANIVSNKNLKIPWNDIFISIAYYYYKIMVILFDDIQKEVIQLVLPRGLNCIDDMFPDKYKYLIVLRHSGKYNPIYLLNNELFKRTAHIEVRLFGATDGIINIIKSIVGYHFKNAEVDIKYDIDLGIINEFAKQNKLTIHRYYVNYSNLCYGVECMGCYIPISSSYYAMSAGVEIIFDEIELPNIISITQFVKKYNSWVVKLSEGKKSAINIYPLIEPRRWIAVDNLIYGFVKYPF